MWEWKKIGKKVDGGMLEKVESSLGYKYPPDANEVDTGIGVKKKQRVKKEMMGGVKLE